MGNIQNALREAQRGTSYQSISYGRSEFQADLERLLIKMELSVKDFERRDRKSLLRAAAGAVRDQAKTKVRVGSREMIVYSVRPGKKRRKQNRRKPSGSDTGKPTKNVGARGGKVSSRYAPGNLRNSIRTLSFRNSPDVFVGARFGGSGAAVAGTSTTNADGWYADLAYGNERGAFKRAVLELAALSAKDKAIEKFKKKAVERFKDRARGNGLQTA